MLNTTGGNDRTPWEDYELKKQNFISKNDETVTPTLCGEKINFFHKGQTETKNKKKLFIHERKNCNLQGSANKDYFHKNSEPQKDTSSKRVDRKSSELTARPRFSSQDSPAKQIPDDPNIDRSISNFGETPIGRSDRDDPIKISIR
jgi:hypothetical protein